MAGRRWKGEEAEDRIFIFILNLFFACLFESHYLFRYRIALYKKKPLKIELIQHQPYTYQSINMVGADKKTEKDDDELPTGVFGDIDIPRRKYSCTGEDEGDRVLEGIFVGVDMSRALFITRLAWLLTLGLV